LGKLSEFYQLGGLIELIRTQSVSGRGTEFSVEYWPVSGNNY